MIAEAIHVPDVINGKKAGSRKKTWQYPVLRIRPRI